MLAIGLKKCVKPLTRHHENLDGVNNEDIVDMETRVSVVERQEPVDRELGTKIVILPAQHLFTHTRAQLGLEIQDSSETKVTTLPALIVLRVLYATTTTHSVHTGKDILVQVETLLSLGYATSSAHERRIEEIRVTVMEFPSDPRKRPRSHSTECLFLSSSDIT